MAMERLLAMFGGQRRAPGGGLGQARIPGVQLPAAEPSGAGRASEWAALERLVSSTFGCGAHGDRYQAVVRVSANALNECRLSGEQPPVSRLVPHHYDP